MKKKKMISVRIAPDVLEKIDEMAEASHRNRTNYIELILIRHIDKEAAKQ